MRFILLAMLCALLISTSIAILELTNLVCKSIDKPFADFEYCHIKAVNRSYKYLSIKVNLFKTPVKKFSVNVAITKKANGYKPFLYNSTIDGCKFFEGKTNSAINYLYLFIKPFTNANHSCPYAHDLLFEKINTRYMDGLMTKLLPVPKGEYGIFTTWLAYNIPRAYVNIYGTLSDF